MGTFQVATEIIAPIKKVWDRLADIGRIAEWNPGVKASHCTSTETIPSGLGSTRFCDLGDNKHLNEEVIKYVDQEAISIRIVNTNLPLERAEVAFTLKENKGDGASMQPSTVVTLSADYKLKYGFIGTLMDIMMFRSRYVQGMKDLLAGLKKDLED